jgi:hypothetical protein
MEGSGVKAITGLMGLVLFLSAAMANAEGDSYSWCVGFAKGVGGQLRQFDKSAFGREPGDTTLIHKLSEFDNANSSTVKSNLIKGLTDSQKCSALPKGSEEAVACRREQKYCNRKIADAGFASAN